MPKLRITDTNLSKIKLPVRGECCLYWDEQLAGFGCRATPSGITFIVQRRINGRNGRTVRDTIGKYGEMSSSKAEKLAATALASLRMDTDLVKAKKIKRVKNKTEQITLREIFDAYMIKKDKRVKDNGEIGFRLTTKKLYDSLMRLYIGRDISKDGSDCDLASMPVAAITKDMIEKKLEILATEPGEREKRPDRSAQAAQCFRLLRALFNFAAQRYEVDGKPVVSIDWIKKVSEDSNLNKTQVRNTIIAENELKDWYKAVLKVTNPVLRDYILWLAFSGMRRSEAMTLRSSDIDFKNKTVKIRAAMSKTGKERILPLTTALASIAERRKDNKDSTKIIALNPFLFKGLKPGQHIQEPKRAIAAICKAINKSWSLHDLRRSYASHGAQLIPYPALKEILGHSTGANDITQKHYLRLDIESLRPEAQKMTDWLANKMGMKAIALEVVNQ